MKTKLSNSAVDKYNECSLCYRLHYLEGIRTIKTGSPLIFGGIIDKALNELLLTKDLNKAKDLFIKNWQKIDQSTIKYNKSDIDQELLDFYQIINDRKEWCTLLNKAMLFLQAYNDEVLPKIKKVIAVQEPITIKNSEGDEITGFLDLIVEWEDGKTYLMDNKTSSVQYSETAAKDNQQLPLYYYATKDKYKLDGIGYIVLSKKINKNKIRKCKLCASLNNFSHKTCINIIYGRRCKGEFEITINPTVDIQYIFNQVEESDIDRVIETFDHVNYCISNEIFATEHNPIRGKFGFCPYKEYYEGSPDFYISVKK
jgi:hypothetical protein